MEPKDSLPCSQKPYTGPYRMQAIEPHPISLGSMLILSSHLRLGLPIGLFPSVFHQYLIYIPLLHNECYMRCLDYVA
jgi:hypothetical protein